MTSKNLFFKLMKQDFQKRIWCPIVIFIGYFLALEVRMLMMFENLQGKADYQAVDLGEYVELRFFGTNIWGFAVLACFAALPCAISGFAYLHSKTQLDLYHSLPVNRAQLFFSKYISGVMQFFAPFVFHVFVCMGIAAGKGAFSGRGFANAMQSIGVSLLVFLLAYAVFLMAVCLTGNLIISIFGSILLFTYSSIISCLYYGLLARFFHTFIIVGEEDAIFTHFGFSPLALLLRLFKQDSGTDVYDAYFKYNADYLWVIAAAVIVYTLFAYLLHWKRASESAGKAIAYQWAEPIIKTLIVIPAAFYSGIFFAEIASDIASGGNDNGWYLFGVVFGFVIMALLIEIIFRFDIKSAFHHKKQLLFNAACVTILFVVFRYDVLGYDTYVPADTELTSCAVSIDDLMAVSPLKRVGKYAVTYMNVTDYRMEHVAIQGNPSVMELARQAAADKWYQEEQTAENMASDSERDYRTVTFGYHLKNGKSVYRQYLVNIADAETKKLLADVFNDEGYKTGTNLMLNSGWEQEYQYLYCVGNTCDEVLEVTPQFQSKLLETYSEEYLQLDFDTVLNTSPVGCMTPQTVEEYNNIIANADFRSIFNYNVRYNGNLIYPQFTKTIALLKENGFDIYETFSADDVNHIVVTYMKELEADEETYSYKTCEYIEIADIFDKEQKQQILDSILDMSLNSQTCRYTDFYDEQFDVTIYMDEQDDGIPRAYRFKKDMVPQFLYELEKYEEAVKQ